MKICSSIYIDWVQFCFKFRYESHLFYFGIVIISFKWLGHLVGSDVTFRDFLPNCVKKFHTYCLRSMNYAGCTMQWHYVKFYYLQNIKHSTILWKLKNVNHIILNFIYNIWVSPSQICLSLFLILCW